MYIPAAAEVDENGDQVTVLPEEVEFPDAEFPPTKAAAARDKKARKPAGGKADGANTVNLNQEEKERGGKADIEVARQKHLEKVSADATFIADTLKSYAPLCETADKANEARDEFFSTKMKDQAFRDKVQAVRDWGSQKHHNESLLVNGTRYKSVKVLFRQEFGRSYEYICRQCKKMDHRLHTLLTAGDDSHVTPPPPAAPAKPSVQQTEPQVTPPPATAQEPEILAVHGIDTLSFTIAERIESAFSFAVSCVDGLSLAETEEFYRDLAAKFQDAADEAYDSQECA
jgi:hypothetical protein